MLKLIEMVRNDTRGPAVAMILAALTAAWLLVDQTITVYDAMAEASYGLVAYKTVISNVVEIGGCFLAALQAKPAVDGAGGLIDALRGEWNAL